MTFQEIRDSLQKAREIQDYSVSTLMHHVSLILDKLVEDENKTITIHGVSGLQPVDPQVVAEFRRTMTEEVIPEIIRTIEQRQKAARQLGHV